MKILRDIYDFWIKAVSGEPLAVFRMLLALIIIVDVSNSLLPHATEYFSQQGLYTGQQYTRRLMFNWRWSVIPETADSETVRFFLYGLLLAAGFTLVGLATRLASIAMFVLMVSLHIRSPFILNAGDALLRAALFFLMLMPSGAVWSIDNLLRRIIGVKTTGLVRPWSMRLAQIQLAVVYVVTGIEKIQGGFDGDWLTGIALDRALALVNIARFGFLTHLPWWMTAPMCWGTLIFEILFPIAVLIKRPRAWFLALGIMLHMGIWMTMEVNHFSFTIMSFYVLFIPAVIWKDIRGRTMTDATPRKYLVFMDGMCPVCMKSRRTLEKLDWLGRLQFKDIHNRAVCEQKLPQASYADMLKRMYVKRPDSACYSGFAAFRSLIPVLPILWPMLPFLWLPGAEFIGKRVYDFVARNRFKYAKCDDEVCSLHLKLVAGNEITPETIQKIIELHHARSNKQA